MVNNNSNNRAAGDVADDVISGISVAAYVTDVTIDDACDDAYVNDDHCTEPFVVGLNERFERAQEIDSTCTSVSVACSSYSIALFNGPCNSAHVQSQHCAPTAVFEWKCQCACNPVDPAFLPWS